MRLNVVAELELVVDDYDDAEDLLMHVIYPDDRVIALTHTMQRRVYVPKRDEELADFGL